MEEHFVMQALDKEIHFIEELAKMHRLTKSWVYRALLKAIEQKFAKKGLPKKYIKERPPFFEDAHRKTLIVFYSDKNSWFMLARTWNMELSSLIRLTIELYKKGILQPDFLSVYTVKTSKGYTGGTLQKTPVGLARYGYLY